MTHQNRATRAFATLTVEEKVDRLRDVIVILSGWLVQAQTGFGEHDARGIENLLTYGQTKPPKEQP